MRRLVTCVGLLEEKEKSMNFPKSSNKYFLVEEEKKSDKKIKSSRPPIWSITIKSPTNESAVLSVGGILTLGHGRGFVLYPGQHMFPVNTGQLVFSGHAVSVTTRPPYQNLACCGHAKVVIAAKK